jgi:transposase
MFELTDQAFARVQPLLPANSRRGKPWRDHRQVLGGILWKLHTGRPWRDVPGRFGPWQTCHSRLRRWQRDGTWPTLWALLAEQAGSGDDRGGQALLAAAQRSAFDQGSCPGRGRSTVGVVHLSWLEVGVVSGCFLVHAPRPLIETLIRTAGRLAPGCGSCRGLVDVA